MKTKNIVSISLTLAIILFLTCVPANAETSEKLFLNNINPTNTSIKFEKIGTLLCTSQACFKRPNDAVISSDGSFVLVTDSSNPSVLKKFNFSAGIFTNSFTLPLIQKTTNTPLLNISLNQSNTKAAIYREPTDGENTLVQIIDLSNNSIKELNSVSSSATKIGAPVFLDADGKKLIAGTLDLSAPGLVIVDTESDSISNTLTVSDIIQSVNVSSNLKQAVITYSADLGQSVSILNITNNSLSTLDLAEDIAFSVDSFLGRVDFDLSGNRAVLSSLGGNNVLHLLDLKNDKLTSLILDKTQDGPTISTISSDGKTAISAGSVIKKSIGFKIYKSIISTDGSILVSSSAPFIDGSIVLDIDISPDQNKIYVLELKNNLKQLKILNFKDLSQISEIPISSDNTQSFLRIDPNGRYAITPNTNTEASVSVVNDLNSAPVFKSIVPNTIAVNSNSAFTINGFVDPSRFSNDLKICFKNNSICATSTTVSRNGQIITGITPKVFVTGLSDITFSAKSLADNSTSSSKYEDAIQFTGASSVSDTFPPDITIQAPKDSSAYNTKRIRVLGKVDGTGSPIDTVTVNGAAATLSSEGTASPNIINFSQDIEFTNDGASQITISAKDKSGNTIDKTIKIIIDTVLPTVSANITPGSSGQFTISGTANGTGTAIASISTNSTPVQFTESENVSFSSTTNSLPVSITVTDKAGNKTQVQISGSTLSDITPPVINISSPPNGQIFKDINSTTITFTVTDNSSVSLVTVNGKSLPISNQYSENITLKPGENLVSISATDSSGNKSSSSIQLSYTPPRSTTTPPKTPDNSQGEKEVITLPPTFDNLNNALIDGLTDDDGNTINIGNASSIELSNPPPIPDGEPASIDPPKTEGVETNPSTDEPLIPKGFSFASDVLFDNDENTLTVSNDEENLYTAVLIDSTGRAFVVGFAFFKPLSNFSSSRTSYKFQTTDGQPLNLITTLTVPGDANEGNARISIIKANDSLATIPLNITPPREVTIGKRVIPRPKIKEPINATLKNNTKQLKLTVKGKSFIGRVATIDGKLQKLLGKGQFFTNVTFVPNDGIKINKFQVLGNKLTLTATIDEDIKPGIKLFNIITPKGADIGAIIFPDVLNDGKLETTASPENLLLETAN